MVSKYQVGDRVLCNVREDVLSVSVFDKNAESRAFRIIALDIVDNKVVGYGLLFEDLKMIAKAGGGYSISKNILKEFNLTPDCLHKHLWFVKDYTIGGLAGIKQCRWCRS